ncbi:MAG: hypothetical protein K9L30_04610 [Desulfobacterales bacterium]|nr:hypothetical protein [Desulfobacterales bacterium]
MKKTISLFSMILLTCLFFSPALADTEIEEDLPWEKFSFNLGGFVASLDSDAQISPDGLGVGVTVDIEEALGLETSINVFRLDSFYRFGRTNRHRFDFSYFDFRRSSEKILQKDIDIFDNTYTVGTTVDSYWNLRIFKGEYSYSFFQDERIDIAGSLGLFVMPLEIGINAAGSGYEEQEITAPLPTLGIRTDFAITPKLFLKQSIDVFYLEYDSFKGSLVDLLIAIEYNIWDHVGLGLGYNVFEFNLETEDEDYPEIDFTGEIGFHYNGLLLYGKIFF